MSWKKHFRTVSNPLDTSANSNQGGSKASANKFSSILPEIYAGHPNRIQRYYQYEDMARDSDIASALETIADFCTQSEEQTDSPFVIHYNEEGTESEVKILKQTLNQWVRLNGFKSKLHGIFKACLQNGDYFFVRDPEDHSWIWIDHMSVELVKMSDDGKEKPEEYLIKNFKPMVTERLGTSVDDVSKYRNPGMGTMSQSRPASSSSGQFQMAGQDRDQRTFRNGTTVANYVAVKADDVIHLALAEDRMGINFPFGQSILDPVFKTFKQKELLEDSIIIYRVQRAPERRVFYIDVGSMNGIRAQSYIEGIKNEIHQRRIPNRTGGGGQVMDAAYNPLCLALDTRIPLLDGRTLTIEELGNEYRSGKENWVYSCDPNTGEVVPGNITWAGTTRLNAEVIRLTLDNGKTLTVTPDHKIPVWGKGFVEAQYISPEDSLISFEKQMKPLSSGKTNEYEQVFNHATKKWIFTHRIIGDFFRKRDKHQQYTFLPENTNKAKSVIHHKDFNRYNNDPRNLAYMNKEDHMSYHIFNKKEYWNNITPELKKELSDKISGSLKKYFASMTPEQKELYSIKCSATVKKWIAEKTINDPISVKEQHRKSGIGRAKYLREHPEALSAWHSHSKSYAENYPNKTFQPNFKMIQFLANSVNQVGGNRLDVLAYTENNPIYQEIMLESNPHKEKENNKLSYDKMTERQLKNILKHFNYRNWKDFVKKVPVFNHKIIKVEKIDNIDTGTITIDGQERWHAHHTFATEAGIFVKNSMLDDYFFAQGSEGRGSKVEVLPSGDCLALDTMIPLLDGRELPLSDIIEEHAQGKQLWVYSCDPNTGEVVPGLVNWAGITRPDTEVCCIMLHNGRTITTTLDHKFPTNRGTITAKQLIKNDILIPFNIEIHGEHVKILDGKSNVWKYCHEIILNFFKNHPLTRDVIQGNVFHINLDTLNNSPENLALSSRIRLSDIVHDGVDDFWSKMSNEEVDIYCDDISDRIRASIANKSKKPSLKQKIHHRIKSLWNQSKKLSEPLPNSVMSVKILPDRIDTGTLTIDGAEIYHNYHTFALSSGVFTFNSLGEITDLSYFTKKMARGLRIPTSYLSLGNDEQQSSYNDGKVGAAMIQEFLFNKFCMRLQNLLVPTFDRFFKQYLGAKGISVDESLFELQFNPPQNFTKYRQIELDLQQTQVYSAVAQNTRLSERFKLKRFLNLTPEEIQTNESQWVEENPEKMNAATGSTSAETEQQGDLSSVGFRPDSAGGDTGDNLDFDLPDEGESNTPDDGPAPTPAAETPSPAPEGGQP